MANIEFSAQLNNMDILRVNKEAFNKSLCGLCDFFIANGGMEGVKCNGSYSRSDGLMTVPHSTRLSIHAIRRAAMCENRK